MSSETYLGREILTIRATEEFSRQGEGSFLRLKDGRILFVYSRFDNIPGDNSPCNLAALWSDDDGETWTEPVCAVRAADYGVTNVMSASLMEMRNGDVGLFYIVKYTPNEDRIMLSRSRDGGKTWYSHTECTLPDRRGYYVLNNDRVIRLKSGRLVMPLAFHRSGAGLSGGKIYVDPRAVCFFLLSDDDGETWHESRDCVFPPFTGTASGFQEPGVVELDNGVVWGYFRTDKMRHYEAFSFDGGDTWTAAQPSRFTAPCSPLLIKRVGETLYAMWNPVPNYNGMGPTYTGRHTMAIAKRENGAWSEPKLVDGDPVKRFSYPAIIPTADGLLVAYMMSDTNGMYYVPGAGVHLRMKKIDPSLI